LLNIFEPLIAVLQLNVSYTYNKPQKFCVQLLGFITPQTPKAHTFGVFIIIIPAQRPVGPRPSCSAASYSKI
ncbi:MAG: hypothetical protein U0L62_04765, partial [Paludibacteraceae bacterium]|nr:hypothetical protein [Paludibacteraceae bacterium]